MVAFRRHYSQTFVLSSKEFASLEQRTATYDTSRGSLLAQFQRSTQCGGVVSVTEICVGIYKAMPDAEGGVHYGVSHAE